MRFLFFPLIYTLGLISCSEKPAKIELSTKIINLDTITSNDTVRSSLVIYNRGNNTLYIYDYVCSCECTITDIVPNAAILPRDSLILGIKVKAYPGDKGSNKDVLCTFKTNADSIYANLHILYKVF